MKLARITEEQFLRQVLQLAKLRGWLTAHFRPARTANGGWRTAVQGDGKGFPDIVLVRHDKVLFVELKVGSAVPTPAQEVWLSALEDAGARVFVWNESDWQTIERELL